MKKYIFQVTIHEGNDEFWEEIENKNKSGCDEVKGEIEFALNHTGFADAEIKLVNFTDD